MTDPIDPIRAALAGRYEIERKIGEGAFATVYLARTFVTTGSSRSR